MAGKSQGIGSARFQRKT